MSTTVLSGSLNQEFCAANEEQSSDHDLTRQPFSLLMTSSQHNLLENQGLVDESYFSASSISSTSSPVSHQPVANDTPRLSSQVSPSSFASPLSLESALGSNSEEYGEGELSRIIHDLIEVHEHNICPDTRFTPEEVLEEQKACYVSKTLRCLLWKINNYNVSTMEELIFKRRTLEERRQYVFVSIHGDERGAESMLPRSEKQSSTAHARLTKSPQCSSFAYCLLQVPPTFSFVLPELSVMLKSGPRWRAAYSCLPFDLCASRWVQSLISGSR